MTASIAGMSRMPPPIARPMRRRRLGSARSGPNRARARATRRKRRTAPATGSRTGGHRRADHQPARRRAATSTAATSADADARAHAAGAADLVAGQVGQRHGVGAHHLSGASQVQLSGGAEVPAAVMPRQTLMNRQAPIASGPSASRLEPCRRRARSRPPVRSCHRAGHRPRSRARATTPPISQAELPSASAKPGATSPDGIGRLGRSSASTSSVGVVVEHHAGQVQTD